MWTRSAAFSASHSSAIEPPSLVRRCSAVERGGENLVARGIVEQVAGELPGEELVVRQIVVERAHDPVAVRPLRVELVGLVAVGVGVAGGVEPGDGHVFAEGGAGEQAVGGRFERGVEVLRGRLLERLISSSVGGRPVRSSVIRRSRRSGSACGEGRKPSASSRARTNRSSGCRGQSLNFTGGGSILAGNGRNDQCSVYSPRRRSSREAAPFRRR